MNKSLPARTLLVLPFSLLALAGCASSDGDATQPAAAPISISNLELTPKSIPVGSVSALTGTVDFQAPDGNVREIAAEVTLPNGSSQTLPRAPVQAATGKTSGPVAVALALGPPGAGKYVITVRLVDDRGGTSNAVSADVEAK